MDVKHIPLNRKKKTGEHCRRIRPKKDEKWRVNVGSQRVPSLPNVFRVIKIE